MQKVKINDEYIYIDDKELDQEETGTIDDNNDLDDTQKLDFDDSLYDTLTDIGEYYE